MKNPIPNIITRFTGQGRSIPEIEWAERSWTHNAFRFLELVFGRKKGIRAEVSVSVENDESGRKIVSYQFHTIEAAIAHFEGMIRGMVPKLVPVRVAVPQFAGAGPGWLPNPGAGYLFAIAFDATGSNNAGNASPTTANVTVSGTDRLMMLRTGSVNDTDTAQTYNGDALTAVPGGKSTYLGAAREGVALYYLIAPDTGTNSLSVSHSSSGKRIWAVNYTGANQTNPIDSVATDAPGSAATSTEAFTQVRASGCWLFGGVSTNQGDEAAGTGTTARGSAAGGSITVDSNGVVPTGRQKLTVTHSSSSTRAYAIVSIAPSVTYTDRSLDLEASSSQYLSRADAAALDLTGDFSVEAWIMLESLPSSGNEMTVLSKYNDGTNQRGYRVGIKNVGGTMGAMMATSTNGTSFSEAQVSFDFKVGRWYHVAWTKSGTTMTLYVDGKSIGTGTVTSTIFSNSANFTIGGYYDGSSAGQYVDGLIKDVRLFSDVRSQSEIKSDAWTENVSDANLVGEWNMNDNVNDTAGSLNMTANGSPLYSVALPWSKPSGVSGSLNMDAGLVSYWTMDQASGASRTDSKGSNTLANNGTVGTTTGKKSNAATTARNSNFLSITDASQSGLDFSSYIAMSLWVNFSSLSNSTNNTLAAKFGSSGNQQYGFVVSKSGGGVVTLRFFVHNGSGLSDQELTVTLNASTWYHLVAVYDAPNGIVSFYQNGEYVGGFTGYPTAPFTGGSAEFRVGNDGNGSSGADAAIDEFGIWNKPLTYGDVLDLYNAGNAIAYIGATEYAQAVDANVAVSASMLTPKTIVRSLDATATGSASVAMIKDFVRTLEATTAITAQALKGLAMELSASTAITASILAQRAYLVAMNAAVAVSATTQTAIGKLLEATASVSATLTKTFSVSQLLEATSTISASIEAGREKVLEAAVAVSSTIQTAIGKTLTANVSIIAKVFAPFWRTKYPAHGDGDDYDVKYPHD